MKIVTSLDNAGIKRLRGWQENPSKHPSLCAVEGERAGLTFAQGLSYRLLQWYVTEKFLEKNVSPVFICEQTTVVSEEVMKKISSSTTPSGVVGIFEKPLTQPILNEQGTLALVQINDPGNMGTLIRTAVALQRKSIVIVEGCYPWSAKVIQSSAGTLSHLEIVCMSWEEIQKKKGSLSLCALTVDGEEKPQALTLTNTLVVVGNEAHGLPKKWQQECNTCIKLPMPGNAESLNASVAGSLAVYVAYLNDTATCQAKCHTI